MTREPACCPSDGGTTPPEPPTLSGPTESDSELAELAKAIAHPMRVAILRILAGTEGCVCGDLVAMLPIAQSTVSQHLKILKDAGLVQGELDGPRTCYCVDPEGLRRLRVQVAGL